LIPLDPGEFDDAPGSTGRISSEGSASGATGGEFPVRFTPPEFMFDDAPGTGVRIGSSISGLVKIGPPGVIGVTTVEPPTTGAP
jgi:hypothetical protein